MTQAKTAEEIAKEIVERWGYYLDRSDLEKTIGKAIRDAEAREREACAMIADEMETCAGGWGNKITHASYSGRVQDAIRSRAAERGR